MRTLVLSNPKSGRAQSQIPHIHRLMAKHTATDHVISNDPAAAEAILAKYSLGADDCLVIHGGDGTAQHAITTLLQGSQPHQLPALAILPGGATNMTAKDVNDSPTLRRCLSQLSLCLPRSEDRARSEDLARSKSLTARPVLEIQTSTRSIYGFFFGAGAIVHGVRYFRQHSCRDQNSRVPKARLGPRSSLAVARTLWGIARNQPPYAGPVAIEHAGTTHQTRLLLVSVLDRLLFGSTPFWGEEHGRARMTLIEHTAQGFMLSLPRVLRGRAPRRRGYHSHNVDCARLAFNGPFTVDGELFDTAGAPITITPTAPLRVLRL